MSVRLDISNGPIPEMTSNICLSTDALEKGLGLIMHRAELPVCLSSIFSVVYYDLGSVLEKKRAARASRYTHLLYTEEIQEVGLGPHRHREKAPEEQHNKMWNLELLFLKRCTSHGVCNTPWNLTTALGRRHYRAFHFTCAKTKAQRGEFVCPRSHN